MDSILMLKMIYEMRICDLLNELYDSLELTEIAMLEVLESSHVDENEDEEDLLLLNELRQTITIEDEDTLLRACHAIYVKLRASQIIRPYSQPFVTCGCNRITSLNFLQKYPPEVCRSLFRFEGSDILKLIEILQIPALLSFDSYRTTSLEALLLFLRTIDNQWISGREALEVYSEALQNKGCPLQNCVGCADGTHVPICRPGGGHQQPSYCGHHMVHCFECLGILTASGLLAAFGPFDGSTHDAMAGDIVGLDLLVQEHLTHDGIEYNLFLDAGYPIGRATITPFRRIRGQSREELEWNRMMCRQRIAVEWGFAKLKNLFKMLTFKSNLKARLSPVAMYFFVAVHLMNLHTCFYGSQIATYFGIRQPTVELCMGTQN